MRLLYISDVYLPRVGGVSTSIRTFMRERGNQVTLIAPDYGSEAAFEEGVVRIPARTVPLDPEDRMMRPSAVLALIDRLRPQSFDLVHIHTPFVAHYTGLALRAACSFPVAETYHTFFEEYLHHYTPFVPRAITRLLVRRFSRRQCNAVNRVVVPSSAMAEVLHAYGVRTPLCVILTGIDCHQFEGGTGARFRTMLAIPPGQPLLLYLGRLAHEKNIDFLFHVLREVHRSLPQAVLVVAGEGPAEPHLRAHARDLGLAEHVRFVGYLDRERELLDAYRAADCFVLASRTETQGLVLLEAMACGVPVVALSKLGTRDMVAVQRGAVTPEDDPRAFASAVVTLLTHPRERERVGAEGRRFAREWSAGTIAERLLFLYRDLVGSANVGRATRAVVRL